MRYFQFAEVGDRFPEPFIQGDRWFPLERLLRQRDVGLPLHRVVARQLLEDDFGFRTSDLDNLLRELQNCKFVRISQIDRAREIVRRIHQAHQSFD